MEGEIDIRRKWKWEAMKRLRHSRWRQSGTEQRAAATA
jgi:hypothetical protein